MQPVRSGDPHRPDQRGLSQSTCQATATVEKLVPVLATTPEAYATFAEYRLPTGNDTVTPSRALFMSVDGSPPLTRALPPLYHVPSAASHRRGLDGVKARVPLDGEHRILGPGNASPG